MNKKILAIMLLLPFSLVIHCSQNNNWANEDYNIPTNHISLGAIGRNAQRVVVWENNPIAFHNNMMINNRSFEEIQIRNQSRFGVGYTNQNFERLSDHELRVMEMLRFFFIL